MGDGVTFAKKVVGLVIRRLFLTHLPGCGHRMSELKVMIVDEFTRLCGKGLGFLGRSG